jgi:hypothetical protein
MGVIPQAPVGVGGLGDVDSRHPPAPELDWGPRGSTRVLSESAPMAETRSTFYHTCEATCDPAVEVRKVERATA